MLEVIDSGRGGNCDRCSRWVAEDTRRYSPYSPYTDSPVVLCSPCGGAYNQGCADTEAADKMDKEQHEDMRAVMRAMAGSGAAAKPDEPKAVDLTDTGLSQRDRIEIAVELRIANTGIDWLDAWIRESRRWEAVLAAMSAYLRQNLPSIPGASMADWQRALVSCAFDDADAVLAEADKRSKPQPELAGTDEYPECGLCNTLLDPDDQSYCSNTHCQRYPGPEVVKAKQESRAEADKRARVAETGHICIPREHGEGGPMTAYCDECGPGGKGGDDGEA